LHCLFKMATARQATDTSSNHDPEKPNHMIIWLDQHIGKPENCERLKRAFGSNTDPTHQTWTMLADKDYDKSIYGNTPIITNFNGVIFLLQPVDNENDCLRAFEENQDKHIFFITSGSMGKEAIPKIIERYRHVFTDPITDKPYVSIYIFCLRIDYHMEWIMDYLDYLQAFNNEQDLLERMTRDIAEYFIMRGERLRGGNELQAAEQHLSWAKILWNQYDKMQQNIKTDDRQAVRETKGMKRIDALIQEVELLRKLNDDESSNSDAEGTGHEPA